MRHRIRWLIVFAAIAIVLSTASCAASEPRVSASLQLTGSQLAVRGAVNHAGAPRVVAALRAVLELQGGAGAWTLLASTPLPVSGSPRRFRLAWTAPASAKVLVVRVAVLHDRRVIAATHPQRVSIKPATKPPPAVPACGGEVPPGKPNGIAWTCSFDDEFDATTGDPDAVNTNSWFPQTTAGAGDYSTGVLGANVCYVNSPQTISVSGGALHLTVLRVSPPRFCGSYVTNYIGGMVSTYQRFDQEYGRFEVRALLPPATTRGLQETLWLWPQNDQLYGGWPASGEVDFAEFFSNQPGVVVPFIHYNFNGLGVDAATNTNTVAPPNGCPIVQGQYNDYAVVWTAGSFTITVNGVTCLIDNYVPGGGLRSPAPFNQPFFLVLTQALGAGANALPLVAPPVPATLSVDYVRVWK